MPNQTKIPFVILGATGDLTFRLLMPAIFRLYLANRWESAVIGYAPEDWSKEQFVSHVHDGLKQFVDEYTDDAWKGFSADLSYVSGQLKKEDLAQLNLGQGSAVFYLALPPGLFGTAAQALADAGLNTSQDGFRRLVIEKPFGHDLASARALREQLHGGWQENQIFRIDHFLGKETAQNLLVFRLTNRFLESIWNAEHIRSVQITYAETLGLEGRWRYYDQAGALRDMIQNHLLQLFTLVAMDSPAVWQADSLHNQKVEVLRAVRNIASEALDENAVRGQYGQGTISDKTVPGYRDEPHIEKSSTTETFAALKLHVDNWRWHGVPFYLRSGKRMGEDYAEVAIQLKEVPRGLFGEGLRNWLIFRMKPDERIDMMVWAKEPGLTLKTRRRTLSTLYRKQDEMEYSAYEQLLLAVLQGDRTSFPRYDEVEEAWRIVDPVLKGWQTGEPEIYAAGTDGPEGQSRLLEYGVDWRQLGEALTETVD